MTRTNLPELRLVIYAKPDHGSGILSVRAAVVQMNAEGYAENIRDYPSEPRYGLVSLYATAQASRDGLGGGTFYGWELRYEDVWSLDLREMEGKVKTLRQITRQMEKLDVSLGRPTDFAGFIGRYAHVIGATSIGRYAQGARSYREGVTWMTVDDTRYWLNLQLREFRGE